MLILKTYLMRDKYFRKILCHRNRGHNSFSLNSTLSCREACINSWLFAKFKLAWLLTFNVSIETNSHYVRTQRAIWHLCLSWIHFCAHNETNLSLCTMRLCRKSVCKTHIVRKEPQVIDNLTNPRKPGKVLKRNSPAFRVRKERIKQRR